ncbi:MAG: hypothetical protein AAF756_21785 [Pseudomonadota bacterium]
MSFPESDWKKFKPLREKALAKFCEMVLEEIESIRSENSLSSHEKYLKIYALVSDSDNRIEEIFDGYSRSRALRQLVMFKTEGLLEQSEFACFSEETIEVLGGYD